MLDDVRRTQVDALSLELETIRDEVVELLSNIGFGLDITQYAGDTTVLARYDFDITSENAVDVIKNALSNQGLQDPYIHEEVIKIYLNHLAKR